MQILKAKWLIIGGKDCQILKNVAIAFDEKIRAIGTQKDLLTRYKDATFLDLKDCVIAPGFVNVHTHLEFSANTTELFYGDFILWLKSIIQKSEKLSQKCTLQIMQEAIESMLKSGTTTIGAISSFGKDIEALANSKARVVLFNEILGSNKDFCEHNWQNFLNRFNHSDRFKNQKFIPAISLHSPYSIHPNLAKRVLEFARKNSLLISTHYLESKHELEWLDGGKGDFKKHLESFIKDPMPMYTKQEFFDIFYDFNTLFTHCVYEDDFSKFKENHSITHCPSSNRLLGNKVLNIKDVINSQAILSMGTDGLSSNVSLSMLDELRHGIFSHGEIDINELCKILFTASTRGGARALGLRTGELREGFLADIAIYKAPKCDESQLLTQLILHTKKVKALYIGGEIYS